jgi:hypothetical protein
MSDSSTQGIKTVLHPVSDLRTAKPVYAALLGVAPSTDGSYYVGFEAAGQHIGLVPDGGTQGMSSQSGGARSCSSGTPKPPQPTFGRTPHRRPKSHKVKLRSRMSPRCQVGVLSELQAEGSTHFPV